jgi:PKD repeat protein
LEYLFVDTNNCTNMDSILIEVINPTQADAGPDLQACDNDSNSLISNFFPSSGGTWNGVGVDTAGLFSPTSTGPGIFDLSYCIGEGTCLNCDTMQFTVLQSPTASFTYNETCLGDSTFFLDSSTPNVGNLVSWDWNFGDNNGISSIQNSTYFYGSVDTFDVTLTIQSSSTCSSDTTIDIVIHPLPSPDFTHPNVACPDSAVQFTLDTLDGIIYTWDFGDGNVGSGINPTHSYSNSGFFTISLIAESAFGCIDSFSSQIEIALRPDANFLINPSQGCGPLAVIINYAPANPSLAFDYVWNFGNGDPLLTNAIPSNPYIFEPTINGRDTFYVIELFVQSPLCQQIDIHRDTVYVRSIPLTQIDPDVDAGCSPLNVTFTNNNFNNVDSLLVYFEDGTIEYYNGTADFSHVFYNLGSVTQIDTVLIVGLNECGSDTQLIPITIFPNNVIADISLSVNAICPGASFEIFNNSIGNAYTYYDLGNGIITPNNPVQSFTYSFDSPGVYTLTQYVYSSDSCSFDSDAIQILVFEDAVSSFEYLQPNFECSGDIEVEFENNSTNAVSYTWTFGNGDTSYMENPVNVYPEEGVYVVQLISESMDACLDTLEAEILIQYAKNNLYVPNALSPLLGIGEVRTFKPKGTCLKEYKISIYNTWGELVWFSNKLEDNTPSEAWDGRHIDTGVLLPQDVYVWEIDAVFENNAVWQGKQYNKQRKNIGSITLIK